MSLARSWRECTQTVSLTVSLLHVIIWWNLVPTLPWGKLHPLPTAVLMLLWYLLGHIQYLRHIVSIRNIGFHGFILFSVSLIPVYHHRIWYFPMMGCVKIMGVGVRVHVSKVGGYQEGVGWKKKGAADTPSRTMYNTCSNFEDLFLLT